MYRELLQQAQRHAARALVVVRREEQLSDSARAALKALAPFGVEERITDHWPGTVLYGSTARVKEFQLSGGAVGVLSTAAVGLFDWLHPNLPEDLCFLRADGTTWLTSIAHEHDAFLELSEAELDDLRQASPTILGEIQQEKTAPSS